jgi:hypothetical protein
MPVPQAFTAEEEMTATEGITSEECKIVTNTPKIVH